jgi:hypothetical protein
MPTRIKKLFPLHVSATLRNKFGFSRHLLPNNSDDSIRNDNHLESSPNNFRDRLHLQIEILLYRQAGKLGQFWSIVDGIPASWFVCSFLVTLLNTAVSTAVVT